MLVTFVLVSCGPPKGQITFVPEATETGTIETVLVSTSRAPTEEPGQVFGAGRSLEPNFARFNVSVPPQHVPGSVTFPKGKRPNLKTDFVVASAQKLPDARALTRAINEEAFQTSQGNRPAWIFVHGYNTSFAQGLYRQVQLQYDMDRPWASVHFSWPSAAQTRYYEYDRESALYSVGALITTLEALADSNATEFNLVAHSMGTALLMDALWVMAQSGHEKFFRKINIVVLMSPDMGVDVFRAQAPNLIERGTPIFVVASEADRALRISALLRGEQDRLGSIQSAEELGGLDVGVIDLTNVKSGDRLGHFKVGTSPEVIEFVRGLHESGQEVFSGKQAGLIGSSAALAQQGGSVTVAPKPSQ